MDDCLHVLCVPGFVRVRHDTLLSPGEDTRNHFMIHEHIKMLIWYIQVKKKFEMFQRQQDLNIVHNRDCFLYQSPVVKQRQEEISKIDQRQRLADVDTVFLYIFPLTFFIFNILYWSFWTSNSWIFHVAKTLLSTKKLGLLLRHHKQNQHLQQ